VDQRFANSVKRDPNLSLVSTSQPKPQTAYETLMIVYMIFGSDLLKCF